jgi:hypothetical protein
LRSIALFQPTWAIGIVLSGALRGSGDTRFPLLVNASSIWFSVLLAWVVVAGLGHGLPAAWLCFAAVAPLAAAAFGTAAFIGLLAVHVAPSWGVLSDSYLPLHLDAISWLSVVALLVAAAGMALAGASALRSPTPQGRLAT